MRIRFDVDVANVAKRHAVVDVPEQVGMRVCQQGMATQLPPFKPVTTTLTPEQITELQRP